MTEGPAIHADYRAFCHIFDVLTWHGTGKSGILPKNTKTPLTKLR
jgi:hypothetical protein